jgi:hypothetical protein
VSTQFYSVCTFRPRRAANTQNASVSRVWKRVAWENQKAQTQTNCIKISSISTSLASII